MPGLTGIELAVAWMYSGRMALPRPELLVRVGDGTSAHRKLTALGAGRVIPGRSAEERVLRLAPEDPTPVAAAALVNMISDALVERRTADAPFEHGERRRAWAKGVAAPVVAAA
jgi:anti-sigma factor RsiW